MSRPITRASPPDDVLDAARFRWLAKRIRRETPHPHFDNSGHYNKWSLLVQNHVVGDFRAAIDIAMAKEDLKMAEETQHA